MNLKKFIHYFNIVMLNIIILYSLLYLLEIGINYKNDKLFKKTRLYYLNALQKKNLGQKIYLNYGVYKLIDKANSVLPLSGYENSKILLCLDENNKPVYFDSDKNGFNNQLNENNDFILIGDSYVQGMCVNNDSILNKQFKKFFFNTVSLGVGGNGPLIELATFKEYKNDYRFNDIIIFITPSNDFEDLNNEMKNSTLLNYLNIKNFKQNLLLKENKDEKIAALNSFFGNKTKRIFNDFFSIYHFNLKSLGNLIEQNIQGKTKSSTNFKNLDNKEVDKLFVKILDEFIKIAKKNEKKIYIVFNAVNPDILYPKTESDQKLKDILLNKKLKKLKEFLDKKNVLYYDFNRYLIKNYNRKNINTMFKKIDGHWDHYTEEGFFEITKQININLIN